LRSIRSFLILRLLGGVALVLGAAGMAGYFLIAGSLGGQFDQNLANRIQGFASILFQTEEGVAFEFSGELMPEYEREERPDFFQLWFEDGSVLERSDSLAGADLELREPLGFEPSFWSAPLPDGRRGRYAARMLEVHHVYPEEGPGRPRAAVLRVAVASGREILASAEQGVLVNCIIVVIALTLLIAFLSWLAVRRGLEPANNLARVLDGIRVDHLPDSLDSTRIGEVPSELGPMVKTTNALIQRVGKALERERRSAADIAHELRTPISELLTVSEVALRSADDTAGSRRALQTIRDVAWRMGRSVSTLLKLARLEEGSETFDCVGVDLGGIVRENLTSLAGTARDRGVALESLVAPGELVEGDDEVLRIVVSNLLSNACQHSPPGGSVRCSLERGPRDWHLRVENEAPDLREEDLQRLTEPFWKKDSARSDRRRSGLGLALSSALVEKTGMAIDFELEAGIFRAILSQASESGLADTSGNGRARPRAQAPAKGAAARSAPSRARAGRRTRPHP